MSVNTTTLKQTMSIPAAQVPTVVKNSMLADIDALAKDLKAFFEELKPIAEQRFVMMKNKKVWYDRENAALFPKFEALTLPKTSTSCDPTRTWKGLDFEGFHFVIMSRQEFNKSFLNDSGNPYLKDGHYLHFPIRNDRILIDEKNGSDTYFLFPNGNQGSWNDSDEITIVPICRLNGKNGQAFDAAQTIGAWLDNELIPEGLNETQENNLRELFKISGKAHRYIEVNAIAVSKRSDDESILGVLDYEHEMFIKNFNDNEIVLEDSDETLEDR